MLSRELLVKGFEFENQRVPLVSPQGIFKPQLLPEMPLSITTAPSGPYNDSFGTDGMLLYRYRGTNPNHRDNESLRLAMSKGVPLIYFHGVIPGKYLAIWPVFIVGDILKELAFKVAADDLNYIHQDFSEMASSRIADSGSDVRRAYITSAVKSRLHQRGFRERVLYAYREQCACCRLRHPELLDAVHIIPDSKPEGIPVVQNGIAMCKLHHAAFDSYLIGIRPDYVIEVRKDVLDEVDGPMLMHGLKDLNKRTIILPSPRDLYPDPSFLDKRYNEFKAAS